MTAYDDEMKRLKAMGEPGRSSLIDLDLTPGAMFRAAFLGEWFYGHTEEQARTKVREFAEDIGDDAPAQLDAGGCSVDRMDSH